MEIMKTLTIGGNTYEIYDEKARSDIEALKKTGTGSGSGSSGGSGDVSGWNAEAKVVALSATSNTTLDEVGYGTCIVMHDANSCVIFDLGNDSGNALDSYLKQNNIQSIDAIHISHFHSDHYQLTTLQNLFAGYDVKNIVFPHVAIDWTRVESGNLSYRQCYEDAKAAAVESGVTCYEPTVEGELFTYGNFKVTCHNVSQAYMESYYGWRYNEWANETEYTNYNNFCMVNVVDFAGHKIVVTGDIMEPAVENTIDVLSIADLIFVPHHGLDLFTSYKAFNRLTARHAVINSAYDTTGLTLKVSRIFAGELLKKGCRVTTTYDGVTAGYSVSEKTITPVELGVLAGNEIYPCAIKPNTDLDMLPDGEYITYSENHAQSMQNVPPFTVAGRKFKLKVETTYHTDVGNRTQIAYTIDTSSRPENARRNYSGGKYNRWVVEGAFDSVKDIATESQLNSLLISQIAEMHDQSFRRLVVRFSSFINALGSGGNWCVEIYKTSENYAIVTAKTYHHGGMTIQRVWYEGSLHPWEFVNPRMEEGVEYRTTERHNDKPVYKKLIIYTNTQAFAGSQHIKVAHGISNLKEMLTVDCTTNGYILPYQTSTTSLCVTSWDTTNITMNNNSSSWDPGRKWHFTMRYTKTTD